MIFEDLALIVMFSYLIEEENKKYKQNEQRNKNKKYKKKWREYVKK